MYNFPEIFDSNGDNVTIKFEPELSDFFSYEYEANALIYNISLLEEEIIESKESY